MTDDTLPLRTPVSPLRGGRPRKQGTTATPSPEGTQACEFFVAGGTLEPDSPSYVKRQADDELFQQVLAGKFCYVLTGRQMGKSSLMVRTARRLTEHGVRTAIIDLSDISTAAGVEQWYLGLILLLKQRLEIAVDPQVWWQQRTSLSPVQRFVTFLRDVVLAEVKAPVAVFIDEIDTTLNLRFSDDFFAAIRSMYNARAYDTQFDRLTFVLIGVATPGDLVKDRTRTPFNIGLGVDLREFSREEAGALRRGLTAVCGEQTDAVFDRIFDWTAGHPYLTQHLCWAAAEEGDGRWSRERVDRLVAREFFSEEGRKDGNLQSVRDRIATSPQRRRLLNLYRQVYIGQQVAEDERSPDQNRLKLFGLIGSAGGWLRVRNEIYRQVFDLDWVKANMPADWARRIAIISTLLVLVVAGIGGYLIYQQQQVIHAAQAQAVIESFRGSTSPEMRIDRLAELFQLTGYADQARQLFYKELNPTDQLALFNLENPRPLQAELLVVIKGLYTDVGLDPQGNALLEAMTNCLAKLGADVTGVLPQEIDHWLQARQEYANTRYPEAIDEYNEAIRLNDENPGTHFERGLAYAAQDDVKAALADFDRVLNLGDRSRRDTDVWHDRVRQALVNNDQLYAAVQGDEGRYTAIAALIVGPTPTPAATPTPTETPVRLLPTPTMVRVAQLSLVKRDDFASPATGWPSYTTPDGSATTGYQNGKYFIELNRGKTQAGGGGVFLSAWGSAGIIADGVLQVRALGPFASPLRQQGTTVGGAEQQGVAFGWRWQSDQSNSSAYAFTVNAVGMCQFLEGQASFWYARAENRVADFDINWPYHTLTAVVERVGVSRQYAVTGYVDGAFCASYILPNYEPGYVGVVASSPGGQGISYFDDYRIYRLP